MESTAMSPRVHSDTEGASVPTSDGRLSQPNDSPFRMMEEEGLIVLSADQRRQRVIRLFEELAPLVSQLSDELCKEDHGRFMATAARIEERAIIIEANLTELEASLNDGDAPVRPSRLLRAMALFSERIRRLVQAYAHMSRQRERNLEVISRLRRQLDEQRKDVFAIRLPRLLSLLAYNQLDGAVQGIHNLQAESELKYGAGNYIPPVAVTYWSFRLMVGAGFLMLLLALYALLNVMGGMFEDRPRVLLHSQEAAQAHRDAEVGAPPIP